LNVLSDLADTMDRIDFDQLPDDDPMCDVLRFVSYGLNYRLAAAKPPSKPKTYRGSRFHLTLTKKQSALYEKAHTEIWQTCLSLLVALDFLQVRGIRTKEGVELRPGGTTGEAYDQSFLFSSQHVPIGSSGSATMNPKLELEATGTARRATWNSETARATKNKMKTNNNTEKNLELPPPPDTPPRRSAKPQKLAADVDLKTELADRIKCLVLATFHKWWPDVDLQMANSILNDIDLIANIIAQRLIDQLAQNPLIDEQRWQLMLKTATRVAFGPHLRIGRNKAFVAAMAECTALAVAPRGSEWVVTAKARLRKRFPELCCNRITLENVDRFFPIMVFDLIVTAEAPHLPGSTE